MAGCGRSNRRRRHRAGSANGDTFYAGIGEQYKTITSEDAPQPVKTLAEQYYVTISAASRWIKEARRRGYVPPKEGTPDD